MSATYSATRPRPVRGLSLYYLGLELKRQFSRPATLFFCVAMPVLFYVLFGNMQGMSQTVGRGNVNGLILLFMGLYGAAMTAATSVSSVAFERPLGWNRELRLTPLKPWAYIVTKIINAMISSVLSLLVLYIVALALGEAKMDAWIWFAGFGISFVCGVTFGALGLMLASFFKGETATGLLVPILLLCCFISGAFAIPLSGSFFAVLQKIVPMGGPVNLMCALLGPDAKVNADVGGLAISDWRIWANIIGWLVVFCVCAGVAYAKDTRRQ